MTIWQALILGVVQGVTEILPISSTAHLILTPYLIDTESTTLAFDVVMNFGSWIAIMIYFRNIWLDIVVGTLNFIKIRGHIYLSHPDRAELRAVIPRFSRMTTEYEKNQFYYSCKTQAQLAGYLLLATIPALLVAFFLEDWIEMYARTPVVIAGALIGGAILLWIADMMGKHVHTLATIKGMQALMIGLGQTLALIPGFSRSGSTITAGRFVGLSQKDSATFAFLLGAPIIFIATVVKLPEFIQQYSISLASIVAFTSAVGATYMTIHWLYQFIQKQSYMVFVVYRIVLGSVILGMYLFSK